MHPTPAIGLIETDDPLTPDALPPLRLARLRLTDFRSYPDFDARFEGRIVAIAGENGVGKTNLLEAISLLGPGRGLRSARPGEIGRAPRSPRPGPSRLIASSRLVLPTPFSPAITTIRPAKRASKAG